jgi:prephenate dehydratase/chorismate mutase/prephenate dehydratase
MAEREQPHTVAFQGELGAYGEAATLAYFGADVAPTPCVSFADVFAAVASGAVDAGLAPIENSQAGSINEVYDLLRVRRVPPLYVTGEISAPVNHCLMALPGQPLSAITRVISHPQALAQSDAFLRALDVEIVAEYDTAGSAKLIRERELLGVAAVASERAAERYQLAILARDIQTVKDNYTRFIAFSLRPAPAPTGPSKTMLLLITPHRPGALYDALGVFAVRGINLLKLESRPSRERPWEYVFYLDVEGAANDAPLADALGELARNVSLALPLGSFPRAV